MASLFLLLTLGWGNDFTFDVQAGEETITFTVEPIAGYEWTHRKEPVVEVRGVFIYGARAVGSYRQWGIELEYTRSDENLVFPLLGLRMRELTERLKLGVRRSFFLFDVVNAFARLGGQASRVTQERVEGGIDVTVVRPIRVRPYLGGGLSFDLHDRVALSFEFTVVFKSYERLEENDLQATSALSLRLF